MSFCNHYNVHVAAVVHVQRGYLNLTLQYTHVKWGFWRSAHAHSESVTQLLI